MIKRFLVSILSLVTVSTLTAEAANKPAPKQKVQPPPPDYFPVRIKDDQGKPIEWWWKYTYTKYDLNGKPSGQKLDDFKNQVVAAEEQPDKSILWKIDTTSPSVKTIHEWYIKRKGKVVWHKEQYGDDPNMFVQFSPERVLLTNPPAKDECWNWKGKGNMGIEIDNTSTVLCQEVVETPAGKFDTIKIQVLGTQGGQPVNMTYWWAPWVGLVKTAAKNSVVDSEASLVDYSFKKPPPKK
ncbi:MAG: hypothetical protein KC777_03985 [Cyanobacteria bacterium HKST-UBA02]|nr:hypothetical protein [Cyanobacteria bacterium HKST-UBA02]